MRNFQSRQASRSTSSFLLLVFGFCFVVFSALQAWPQSDQGTITGVVKDSSGAVIQGAKVTLGNTETGLTLQVRTDRSGVYVFFAG